MNNIEIDAIQLEKDIQQLLIAFGEKHPEAIKKVKIQATNC